MKLHDLETAQVVVMGDVKENNRYLVFKNILNPQGKKVDYLFVSNTGWMDSSSYLEDMTCPGYEDRFSINQVYNRPYNKAAHVGPPGLNEALSFNLKLIWDRNVSMPDEITLDEKVAETDEFGSKEITFY